MSKECREYHSQYIYQSSAYGIAGEFYRPSRQSLPMHGAAILPVTGGLSSQRTAGFSLDGLVSFESVFVEVGGSYDQCHDTQTSYSYSVIEGLNIADVLTADRVVSRLMVYSPEEDHGGEHTFDITGSHFDNLKICGNHIDVKLDTGAFHELNSHSKFHDAYKNKKADELLLFNRLCGLKDEQLAELEETYHALHGLTGMVKTWRADQAREPKDRYICSAVSHLDLKSYAGQNSELQGYGAVICIPKFGVIRLGEMVVYKHSRSLTMFTVQMCSVSSGSLSGAYASTGGGNGLP
ncbi:MAG TPA: hypothetical protein VNW97_13175 [Candidatus Saccharimonadales bacterium]|jgi:hypothetical protein|nr:hypothetical protein [Candidatus Saccharimonadales bacterium]